MSLERTLEKFIDEQGLWRNEGRQGLINLCKIVRALGYQDPCYSGQMAPGAALGDLVLFLEDNPGAVQAVIDWVGDQRNTDWEEQLKTHLVDEDDEEPEDDEDK